MAGGTSPSGGSTRYIETTRGVLSYSELAPLLAERVLDLEQRIAAAEFDSCSLDERFILTLHSGIAADLLPDMAGRWRLTEVRIRDHHPPAAHKLPSLMKDYSEDLIARLSRLSAEFNEFFLETLAFAEGKLLSIHPFLDFNGRVTRLFLRELLRRLELPPVDLVPLGTSSEPDYFDALQAADRLDWGPLSEFWRFRFLNFYSSDETE